MNNLLRNRMVVAGKIGMLLVTTTLLVATSKPADCDHRAAPVVFNAAGTCGPGGLIVVETGGWSSTVTLANAAALGLPPLDPSQGASGRYVGMACPFTVEKGEWRFDWTCSVSAGGGSGGAGADGGAGGVGGLTMSCLRSCIAHLGKNGDLLFTCTGARGELLCESRLTKVVLP